jgi:hypothetical protein
MKDQIGRTAGIIWKILHERECVAITQLPKAVRAKQTIAYQALGWLAREGKVEYRSQGNVTYVLLAASEKRGTA